MADPNEQRHPSSLTEEEKAALAKADPAAFDEDGDDEDDATGVDAAAAAEKTGAEASAAAAVDPPAAGDAAKADDGKAAAAEASEDDASKPGFIPKARFDEVNGRAKDLERRVQELEAAQKTLQATPERDYSAEATTLQGTLDAAIKSLQDRYDEGDIELAELLREQTRATSEYQNGMRELTKAEAAATALAEFDRRDAAKQAASAKELWETAISNWRTEHAEFLENPVRRDAVSRLLDQFGDDPKLDDAALIAKVQDAAFEAFNWSKPDPTGNTTTPDPHAERRRAAAAATADAAAMPSLPQGGVGNRGNADSTVDLSNLKQGSFSKMPAAEQEKLLGPGGL